MSRLRLIGFLIVLESIAGPATQGEEPVPVRDVVYRTVGETALKLDLYLPRESDEVGAAATEGVPLVVWVHGGAWRSGTKDDVPIRDLTQRGFAIASVDYRLSPQAKFPAQTEDLHAAIRFVKENAAKYGLDPRRYAVAGSSAGGHLAALVGVTSDVAAVGGSTDKKENSSGVSAIVSFYGASNLESILEQSTEHGRSVRVPALGLLLGDLPDRLPELARAASPVAHLDADDPPLLLIHGDADPQMPYAQAIELRDAYARLDLSAELVTVEGGLHGGERFYDDAMLDRVAEFLKRHAAPADANE